MIKSILELIPYGKENAISRKMLTAKCLDEGLIPSEVTDKDRYMRQLITDTRQYAAIVYREEGGYYLPTENDIEDLRKYVQTEQKRAVAIFCSVKFAEQLLKSMTLDGQLKMEDIDAGSGVT